MKIIKFQASWCGPCKVLSETLSTMSLPFVLEEVDVDEDTESAIVYGIRGVPTMLLVDENNNILERIVGNISKFDLEQKLSPYVGE